MRINNLRHFRIVIFLVAFFILGTGFGYWSAKKDINLNIVGKQVEINRVSPEDKQDVNFAIFWQVWDQLSQKYIDKASIKPNEMVYGAIKGMTSALGDPYTMFLSPTENSQSKEDLGGAFEGVGMELGYNKDQILQVVAPLDGTPAKKAGVRAGDLILKIADKTTEGLSLPDAVKLIRGPRGTKVKLTMLHDKADRSYEVEISRETIVVPSVVLEFIDNNQIAHLKMSRFGDRTNEEWLAAVEKIVSRDPAVKGIILDLRNNPGGYLTGSVFIASEFLSKGIVVQQEHADGQKESYSVDRLGKLTSYPMVVLINKGSASASEIVAGALKDYKRAKIIGETSFGKGTVQEAEDFPGGAGLHITIARWLTPNGNSINKSGISPDIEVKNDQAKPDEDNQLSKAIEIVKDL